MPWMAISIVNALLAGIVSKFLGNWNLDDGMLALDGIEPMGAGLHEPPVTCSPFVMVSPVPAQKLMKLFVDVREATWPASGVAWPSCSKPLAITDGSSVSDFCGSPPAPPDAPPLAPAPLVPAALFALLTSLWMALAAFF